MAAKRRQKGNTQLNPAAAEKEMRAFQLAVMGFTYQQIADRLGYSNRGTAHRAITRHIRTEISPKVEEYRVLNTARYEALLATVMPQATDASNKNNLWAVDRAIVLISSLNKLHGLDVPVVQQVQTEGALTVRFVNDWRGSRDGGGVVEAARDGGTSPALEAAATRDDGDPTGE
jgi:hypothetical protein